MRKYTPITPDQAEFITANYKKLSMISMADELNIPTPRIRKYMKDNNLTVTKEEIQAIKYAKYLENRKKKEASKPKKYIPFQWLPY